MAWTKFQSVIAVVMVLTGTINTLTTKWADHLSAPGSDGVVRDFDHPFVQSCSMFLGEVFCLLAFKIIFWNYFRRQDATNEEPQLVRGSQDFNPLIFFAPAMCDMTATSLMYIGLNLTYASSFQMLRGSVIIFVALLSVAFLERKISVKQWIGMLHVIVGLAVVGLSDFLLKSSSAESKDTNGILTGDLLIIMAQIITAIQMVYEEKYVAGKDIPALQAVGWEGVFGLLVLGLLQFPFYYIHVPRPFSNNAHSSLEDFPDALVQVFNNTWIGVALLGTIASIAFFNFAGISVTKEMSATTRMVLDSVRTLFIWLVSLFLGWQGFHPLQILGFFLLVAGMCVYNDLLPNLSLVREWFQRRRGANESLISNQPADIP